MRPLDADIAVVTAVVVLFILFNPVKSLRPPDVPTCKVSVSSSCASAVILLEDPYNEHLALATNKSFSSL